MSRWGAGQSPKIKHTVLDHSDDCQRLEIISYRIGDGLSGKNG
jgi:hypothetical protein